MDSTTLYIIVFVMLLGAFVLGLYVGSRYVNILAPRAALGKDSGEQLAGVPPTKTQNPAANDDGYNLDLQDHQPGVHIRATLARERAGTLPKERQPVRADSKLDFARMGRGNSAKPDDLVQIEGIGPYFAKKLNEIGIYNFKQLAAMNDYDIQVIALRIGFFFNRIKREDWQGQAQKLLKKK